MREKVLMGRIVLSVVLAFLFLFAFAFICSLSFNWWTIPSLILFGWCALGFWSAGIDFKNELDNK